MMKITEVIGRDVKIHFIFNEIRVISLEKRRYFKTNVMLCLILGV